MSALYGLHMSVDAHAETSLRLLSERQIRLNPDEDDESRLVFLTDPEGLAVERYRLLRRRLCTLHPHGGVLLITSSNPGEGKTLTSINLTWALAEAGQPSCLVDMDFRAPCISQTLDYTFEQGGVQEVLEGQAKISDVICKIGIPHFHILGIRRRVSSPGHFFYAKAVEDMIVELRNRFKWVILDFAPTVPMADVSEMIPYIDGAVLVVRTGKTDKSMLDPAIEVIGSKLWGVIANDCPISGSAYYSSYGKRPM